MRKSDRNPDNSRCYLTLCAVFYLIVAGAIPAANADSDTSLRNSKIQLAQRSEHSTSDARSSHQHSQSQSFRKRPTRPFIHYTPKGWVRADAPRRGTMAICKILGRSFRCLKKEKERFGDQLKLIEEEIRALEQ